MNKFISSKKTLFEQSLSPQEICQRLSVYFQTPIIPGETLLFFDEIQQCKPALSKLRYFYEKYPELHLIAAGSLLEFAIKEIPSIGVGRERSMFIYPFSFEDFLNALGENIKVEAYNYPITHTAANGIPLGAEANHKYRRMILLDTGLYQRVLGLETSNLLLSDDFKIVNKGTIAEMFVGLEFLKSASCFEPKQLYCWAKEKSKGNAQVDFVVQSGETIIPIEVKSGTQGAMQSLRQFMSEKKIQRGVRTSLENFCNYNAIDVYPLYAITNVLNQFEKVQSV